MAEWKLDRDNIPAFVFLIDCILEDHQTTKSADQGLKKLYRHIADTGPKNKESISERTIERAFGLRQQLREKDNLSVQHVYMPKLKTLDTITRFYFLENPITYSTYRARFTKQIDAHYQNNEVSETILATVFKKLPYKIELQQEQICQLQQLLEELKEGTLEDFVAQITPQQRKPFNDNAVALKNEIERLVVEKISASEQKMRNSMLLYRWLGGFGLLFAATPKLSSLKEELLEDFLHAYEDEIDLRGENDDDLDTDIDDEDDDYGDVL